MSNSQERTRTQPPAEDRWDTVCSRVRKPKNLKKSVKQLAKIYWQHTRLALFVVMICAACSTVFTRSSDQRF